jgi:hypothetical protein
MPDDGAPDAPEEGPPEEGPENQEQEQEPETGALRAWFAANRTLALGLGSLGLCGIIAVDLYFMTRGSSEPSAPALAVKASEPPAAKIAAAPAPSASSAQAVAPSADSSAPGLDFESDDG